MNKSCAPVSRAILAFASLVLTLADTRTVLADRLIFNGDFELGNVGFTSGYRFSPGNILDVQTYDIVKDPHLSHPDAVSYPDHTTGSGLMMAVNGAIVPNVVVWSQTIAVSPGANYDFSAWISSWTPISPARLDFLFNDVSIGTFNAPFSAGVWEKFAASWNSGSNTSVTISVIDRNTDFSGNDFAIDDLALQGPAATPEPASLTALAVGVVSLLGYGWFRCRPRLR